MATRAVRPKWRDDDAGAGNGVPMQEAHVMYQAAQDHMSRLSAGHAQRIVRLFENTGMSDQAGMARVLELMRPYTHADASDEDWEALRAVLRKRIHWHRNYDKDQGLELEARLAPLETLYRELAPADPISRHRWLFSSSWPELPARDEDSGVKAESVTAARTAALDEVIRGLGMAGVQRLIEVCADRYSLGVALANLEQDADIGRPGSSSKGATSCLPPQSAIASPACCATYRKRAACR